MLVIAQYRAQFRVSFIAHATHVVALYLLLCIDGNQQKSL